MITKNLPSGKHHSIHRRLSIFPLIVLGAASITLSQGLHGQQGAVVGQSEKEIKIIQQKTEWSRNQIEMAQKALSDNDFNGRDYESAFALSKSSLDALPSGGEATAGLRRIAMETFSMASVALAKLRISEGRYEDATLVVATATSKPYNSTYPQLIALKEELASPDQFNRTMTPGSISKVELAKQLLNEAQGFTQAGKYDAAFTDYQKVLNLDPQNTAARKGMQEVNNYRTDYADAAHNERRSEMLGQVAKAWELPVPKYDTGASTIVEQSPIEVKGTSAISRKLQEIRIPQLTLSDETVREAVDKLQKKSRTLDTTESDPSNKGVNIVLKLDPAREAVDGGTKINLSLNDIPLGEALKYIASAANLKVKIEPYAVAIVPLSEPSETLISKEYKVSPSFISGVGSASSPASPSAGGGQGLPSSVGKSTAKDFLESQGVTFPPGASATYLPSTSKLLVKNTQPNLDLIDSLVEVSLNTPPSQVEIETRFLEVSQNNLQELGFDWLLGAFNLPGGSGVYGGGGTTGNQNNNGPWPFVQNIAPVGPVGNISGDGTGNLTAGNRTGSAAIKANALDGLLFGSPVGPAAGILSLAGVFTNPQFQVVLRAINQQKGADLLSAPKVTVTSGRTATIKITRKFPYPLDYSPPQVPQTQGSSSGGQVATPATPTSFETRNVGVEMEVQPTVGPDGYTIDLHLSPQITEFQGFINYGTPIATTAPKYVEVAGERFPLGSAQVTLTENKIQQPVFSVRQVDTQVTIYDGSTVVLGGLLREDVQKVQDKTPIAGDLPLVGSLFRSSANQRIKRNLLIFVTAGLLDPAGQPLVKSVENNQEIPAPDSATVASEAVPGDPSTASKSSR